QAMDEADLDPKRYPPRAVHGVISRAKSLLMNSQSLSLNHQSYFEEQAGKVYQRYEELLARNNAVDFDDLLLKVVHLLRNSSEVLTKYQRRYLHILIDEFQDTNVAQYTLAKLLAEGYKNICVVGDADQSIYGWRHADIRNILSFQNDFPEARVIALEENYRSTGTILEAAKHLISTNRMRLAKDLWTSKEKGHPVVVHEVYNEEEEAQFVIREIGRLTADESLTPGNCAVMYRVNAQSRSLEEACLRYGMKYKLVGGVRFYQRREVKDVMAYLRLINNPFDEVSLTRVINIPLRGIGQRSVDELTRWARSQNIPLFTAIENLAGGDVTGHPLSPRAARPIAEFAGLIKSLVDDSKRLDVVELIDEVLERTGYRQYLFDRGERAEERWENVMELRNTAQEFRLIDPPTGLADLLERLALVADVDTYEESPDAITLITLHQAKGLEFPVVFMVGMEDGLLPHVRSLDSAEQIEEERRLCYVGMTRSRERLYLLRAFRRGFTGSRGSGGASRFLYEIPRHLITSATALEKPPQSPWEPSVATAKPETQHVFPSLQAGDKVQHNTFGEGMVVSCVPSSDDYEVTVAFTEGAGVKRLLLSFARLEKVD
ncbi:MAG: UvrD-helicase domain-containing protein, partial [Dehalococcoidia bacterium]|nr:UvrD-helicase domain-containing protein [Dehalococcoidia bacterium]